MKAAFVFLVLDLLCFLQWGSCVDPVAYECSTKYPRPPLATTDAVSAATIKTNIDRVVAQLVAKVVPTGFTTTSYGSGASAIYGLLQCRTGISSKNCTACAKGAQAEINARCAKDGKARFWFELCYLRYDTENFVGKLDRMDSYITGNNAGNASDPKAFSEKVAKLMQQVTAMAVVPGNGALGKGQVKVSPKVTLYGLAECTRDLPPSVCSGCLTTAVSK